jgi:pyrroloquinoline-quinone synthase
MEMKQFWQEMEARIAKYDLLCHPFYKAWSQGELTREDLRAYAAEYAHHVAAFPDYLGEFHARLEPGALATAVLENKGDEEGVGSPYGRSHEELWMDFAEGMGGERKRSAAPLAETRKLMERFTRTSRRCRGWPKKKLAACARSTALMLEPAATLRCT